MKALVVLILHALLVLGIFIGLVGSAKEYLAMISIQLLACALSSAGFIYFAKSGKSLFTKAYYILMSVLAVILMADGVARLLFQTRIMDVI